MIIFYIAIGVVVGLGLFSLVCLIGEGIGWVGGVLLDETVEGIKEEWKADKEYLNKKLKG